MTPPQPPTSTLFPSTTLFRSPRPPAGQPPSRHPPRSRGCTGAVDSGADDGMERSEEHTSELQSRGHLVCRLLLEKKNTRRRRGRDILDDGARRDCIMESLDGG